MLYLHDQTRRLICLAAFFALCIVPTAAVGVWCIAWHLPSHVRGEAQRLQQQFGLDVALDGLRHPRPGVVVYEGLRLADPETKQGLLWCGRLEVTWTEAVVSQGPPRPAVVLASPQVEIEAAGVDRLWQLLEQVIQCQRGQAEMELRMALGQVMLRVGEKSQTLNAVEGGIGAFPAGVQAQAAFRLADTTAAEPIRMRVVRNRQIVPPVNDLQLDTGGNSLPCELLAVALADLRPLAPGRFSGWAWAHPTSAGWEGAVSGRLQGVDLAVLGGEHFPHHLRGPAEVILQRARFRNGRLEEAAGELTAGPGEIGRPLVEAAAASLGLTRSALRLPGGDPLPYDQLALAFAIDARGLRLAGQCAGAKPGTMLRAGGLALLGEPAAQPQPVAALIQAFAPPTAAQVPISQQSDWLARRLPMPDAASTPRPR